MFAEAVAGCGVTSLLGLLFNVWVSRIKQKRSEERTRLSNVLFGWTVDNCDSWTYVSPLLLQGVLYPTCIAFGWMTWSATNSQLHWYDREGSVWGEAAPDLFYARIFLYLFFGYLVQSSFVGVSDLLLLIHHVTCMLGIVITLASPVAGVVCCLGMFSLECGSLFFNIWCLKEVLCEEYPDSFGVVSFVSSLFYPAMTISNIMGSFFLAVSIQQAWTSKHYSLAILFGVCSGVMLLMRQKECLTWLLGLQPRPKAVPVYKTS